MKKRYFLPLLMTLLMLSGVVRTYADQITVGGQNRTYIKYVPKELGENRPLLVSMHGMNQDANYQKGMMQIESIADTAKFAVVFPEGINRAWDISGTSDINFVLAVIDDMAKKHAIDKNRVYLSGFSMGGMFTYHAMNHIADRIAAFAPISGYPMGGQPFTSSRPVPIIHTHGTSDDVVDFGGVQRSLDGWISRNGCEPTAIVTERYRTNGATRYQWGPGDESAEVVLLQLANKGHWVSNDGFYTGEEIWNFCKRYSLEGGQPKLSINYPLPGGEFLTVGSGSDYKVHFEADPTSDVSEIASVAYYCDNNLIGQVTEAPYTLEWTDVKRGKHQLKVVAIDREGRISARARSFAVRIALNTVEMSAGFKADGIVPAGWVMYDSRSLRVGERTGLSGNNRVIKLTGSPRDFDYAMLVNNIFGDEDGGYAAYADPRSTQSLFLAAGNYDLTFKTCGWSSTELGDTRCKVIDVLTDEVLAESAAPVTVCLDKSAAAPFSGVTEVKVSFTLDENTLTKVVFYTPNAKKADMLIADIKLKKVSTQGIDDVSAGEAEVVGVTYYDMLGRQHQTPVNGPMVRRIQYADGTYTTDKISVKK